MRHDQLTYITSPQNPRVKNIVRLRERRERDRSDLFLIEGYRELRRACDGNIKIEEIYFCPELFLGENEEDLIEDCEKRGAKLFRCLPGIFQKISYRDRPDGLLGVGVQMKKNLGDLQWEKPPLLLVAEAIEKPGNLGTILRSSDAVGVDGLIVCDRCTDLHNPNVVRASVGTLFTVPVVETTGDETEAWLQENKIQVLAATPSATLEFTEVDLTGPLAILVGTEQLGLSSRWMEKADIQVRIPMRGVADSLNVAMAATLLLYEALRQRNSSK